MNMNVYMHQFIYIAITLLLFLGLCCPRCTQTWFGVTLDGNRDYSYNHIIPLLHPACTLIASLMILIYFLGCVVHDVNRNGQRER